MGCSARVAAWYGGNKPNRTAGWTWTAPCRSTIAPAQTSPLAPRRASATRVQSADRLRFVRARGVAATRPGVPVRRGEAEIPLATLRVCDDESLAVRDRVELRRMTDSLRRPAAAVKHDEQR